MYDTVRVTLAGVRPERIDLNQDYSLSLYSGTGEYRNAQKILRMNEVNGSSAYNGTVGITYNYEQAYMNIQCSSLPALIYGTSLKALAYEDIPKAIDKLQALIGQYVDADIRSEGIITRLDNSTVYEVERKVGDYISVLDEITPLKRRRSDKKVYEGETVRYDNNTRSVGFYDKVEKAKQGEQGVDARAEGNLLRYEIQYKSSQGISSAYKLGKGVHFALPDLYSEEVARKTLRLRQDTFTQFFPLDVNKVLARHFGQLEQIGSMYRTNKAATATIFVLLKSGKLTHREAIKIAEATGISRQALSSWRKKLQDLDALHTENIDLYEEVRSLIKAEVGDAA